MQTIKKILLCGLFSFLISLASIVKITLPFTPVPITLQLTVCLVSGALLGASGGAASMLVYILAGAIGLPVFAGSASGALYIIGPTGGFLLGFIFCSFLAGKLNGLFYKSNGTFFMQFASIFVSFAISTIPLYFLGTLFFSFVTGCGIAKAVALAAMPFFWIDLIKITVSALFAWIALRIVA